ncbi:MAG TPA: hypothetical protein DCQ30_02430, partial [Acidimicrobiaceae bacterium]|nr:hypothetical protein [Acidimicrobiaceae bacterium]
MLPWLVVTVTYVLLASIANLPAWIHGPTHEIQNYGGDLSEGVWFVAVTPYSLLHGHNPFFTNYINYPYGANLMTNTTMFFPGVVLAPITFIWGSVATFNVLMVLAIAGSATAAFAVFLRWAPWKPAAFAGGLLYGFSPYVSGAGYGHLNVLIIVFPPLLLLLLDNVLVRQRGNPFGWGALLGLVAVCQFFTSTDVLASSAVMALAGTVVLIVSRPRQLSAKVGFATKSLATGAAIFVLLCAYPIHVLLSGPQHIVGTTQPLNALAGFSSDLLSSVFPTLNEAISPSALQHVANLFVYHDYSENGAYIGVPLLLVMLALVVRFRRLAVVRFATAMVVIAYIMSLGGRLRVDGRLTVVRLPFDVFRHLPLLDNLLAVRFSSYVFLFAGMILAVGMDRIHGDATVPRRRLWAGSACALAAFSLFPLIPHWPYDFRDIQVPAFFDTSAVDTVPQGSVLLPYPFPTGFHADSMIWQA